MDALTALDYARIYDALVGMTALSQPNVEVTKGSFKKSALMHMATLQNASGYISVSAALISSGIDTYQPQAVARAISKWRTALAEYSGRAAWSHQDIARALASARAFAGYLNTLTGRMGKYFDTIDDKVQGRAFISNSKPDKLHKALSAQYSTRMSTLTKNQMSLQSNNGPISVFTRAASGL
jgi:hypothetical protein